MTFRFTLSMTVQAGSDDEARELRDEAMSLVATHERLAPSVLGIVGHDPRPVADRRGVA